MPKFKLPDLGNRDIAVQLSRSELRAEADRDLARRSIAGVFSFLVLWLIIYFTIAFDQVNRALLEFLGFMLAAAVVGRLYLALNFSRLYAANPAMWRTLFGLGTIVSAAIWGGVCALAMNYNGLMRPATVMVMLSTAGIAAGGIVSLAPSPRLGGLFVVLLLFPIVPMALLSGLAPGKGIALLFLTFFVFMFVMWRRLFNEYWRALAGRAELVRAKEAAEAATLAKGQFIANVSHELRTPLTAIIGSLGMIESYPPKNIDEQTMDMIGMAYQNSKRLSLLINDILDFEKLNADHMEFRSMPIRLGAFLEQALELNHSYAETYRVTFELEKPPAEIEVFADEQRLMQVMTNLLSNAAKHSPAGGQVSVFVRMNGGKIRVSVRDHGAGVPEEFRKHIFEKFAQANNSSTNKSSGTGLGLAISKAIVEKMGGTIDFDSVPGQGATFHFELPLLPGRESAP